MKEVAGLVGLSQPTFRKVYFSECRKRKQARLKVEMLQLTRLKPGRYVVEVRIRGGGEDSGARRRAFSIIRANRR